MARTRFIRNPTGSLRISPNAVAALLMMPVTSWAGIPNMPRTSLKNVHAAPRRSPVTKTWRRIRIATFCTRAQMLGMRINWPKMGMLLRIRSMTKFLMGSRMQRGIMRQNRPKTSPDNLPAKSLMTSTTF